MGVLSHFSRVRLFATPWTVACQAPPYMGFSRQEYWSGLPFPSPGALLNPWTEPKSLMSPSLAGGFFTTSTTKEAQKYGLRCYKKCLKGTGLGTSLSPEVKMPPSNAGDVDSLFGW